MTRISNIMKRILFTAAAIIAAALSANAQQVDTIKISNITTTHIRFSSEIKYVDLSNKVLAAKIVEGSRDIIALKAKEPFDFITTMPCLEANGAMHTYLVQFEEYPKQLVIEEGSSRPVTSEKLQSPDNGNFFEALHPTSSNLPANASILEQALRQPKSLYHIGSKAYGISIFCDNVFIKDDVMYVVLNIDNKSAITYSLSEPRFSIESKKRTKRGLVYEKQIFPKNILGMEPIAPNAQTKMVFSFDKISVLQGQVFRAYLYESGGTRNYVITFSEKDFNKAAPLP